MNLSDRPGTLPAPRRTPYGLLRVAAFEGDDTLPARSEVVVIGGGIMGVATAYWLARQGVPVLLCEKAEIGCESSSRAFGWVMELLDHPVNQPLTQAGKRLWQQWGQGEVPGTGYRRDGLYYLAENETELQIFDGWFRGAAGHIDPATRMLTPAEVAAQLPGLARPMLGALHAPTDGGVEPVLAAPAIAAAARLAGARIVTGCAVRGLDVQAGRVAGVFTEKGHVATSTVVCATNAWTRLFCGNHGVDVPQLYAFMSMGCSTPVDGPEGCGGTMGWAWRKQLDGGYALGGLMGIRSPLTRDALKIGAQFKPLMQAMGPMGKVDLGRDAWNDLRLARRWNPRKRSPFERHRVLGGTTDSAVAGRSLALNTQAFPSLQTAQVAQTWSGALTTTPDGKPVIGAVDSLPGLHLITACGLGMTWAPAVGQAMAALVTGGTPAIDLRPYRLGRFTDGSPLELAV